VKKGRKREVVDKGTRKQQVYDLVWPKSWKKKIPACFNRVKGAGIVERSGVKTAMARWTRDRLSFLKRQHQKGWGKLTTIKSIGLLHTEKGRGPSETRTLLDLREGTGMREEANRGVNHPLLGKGKEFTYLREKDAGGVTPAGVNSEEKSGKTGEGRGSTGNFKFRASLEIKTICNEEE